MTKTLALSRQANYHKSLISGVLDCGPRFRILQAIHPDRNVLTDMYGKVNGDEEMRGQTENRIMR